MNQKKMLVGLIIFLLILNAATIITVLAHLGNQDSGATEVKPDTQQPENIPETMRVRYLSEKLNLNQTQQEEFRKASQNYNRQARAISQEMSKLRNDLLVELDRDLPDHHAMDSISEQIGSKHVDLKKLTINYYLELKQICTVEQRENLYRLFQNILNPDGELSLPRGQGPPDGTPRGRGRRSKPVRF